MKYYTVALTNNSKRKFIVTTMTENEMGMQQPAQTVESTMNIAPHHPAHNQIYNPAISQNNNNPIHHENNTITLQINTQTKDINILPVMGPAQLITPPKSNSPEEHTTCNKWLTNIIDKLTPSRPILDLTDKVALRDAKQQLQNLRHNHFLDNLKEINTPWTNEIYTDGSLENGRGVYAVLFKTKETYLNDIQPCIQGAYDGPSNSSTLMELLAVYHAILLCPKNKDITIYTDSRNVIHTWRKLKDINKKYETGKRQKLTNSLLWMNIRRLLDKKEGITGALA